LIFPSFAAEHSFPQNDLEKNLDYSDRIEAPPSHHSDEVPKTTLFISLSSSFVVIFPSSAAKHISPQNDVEKIPIIRIASKHPMPSIAPITPMKFQSTLSINLSSNIVIFPSSAVQFSQVLFLLFVAEVKRGILLFCFFVLHLCSVFVL
jgi:hypothetical protein